jgi:hypothetical protein
MSAMRSMRGLVGMSTRVVPRPLTIYAERVESVSGRVPILVMPIRSRPCCSQPAADAHGTQQLREPDFGIISDRKPTLRS